MNADEIPLFRRVRNKQGSLIYNSKCLFIIIIGYVIGVLISELYYSYMSQISIQQITIPKINSTRYNRSSQYTSVTNELHDNVKILCWIMTYPQNHKSKAANALKTWGKRCNKILIMSSEEDEDFSDILVALPVVEGRDNLWGKTKEAFKYIYENHYNEYDWFLKADDDTYVIVDNLRLLLYEYDTRTPIYFGYKFSVYVNQGYMSGGGGYVLSKEALKRFIEIALPEPDLCYRGYKGSEDVEIGDCLENVGVIAGDSRDIDKRGRFFVFPPENHLLVEIIKMKFWYWQYMYYKSFEGLSCCSDYAISFHYIEEAAMYILDYLIYNAKPYGIIQGQPKLPHQTIYIERSIPEYILN